jgi:hypothetical protein
MEPVMSFTYCHHMDRLSSELIEAYRRIEDQDDLWPVRPDSPDEISAIHHQMAEHRKSCSLCHRLAALVSNALREQSPIQRPH